MGTSELYGLLRDFAVLKKIGGHQEDRARKRSFRREEGMYRTRETITSDRSLGTGPDLWKVVDGFPRTRKIEADQVSAHYTIHGTLCASPEQE